MNNYIDDKQFAQVTEIVHLHLCKDSYITSNDFSLLLSEFNRNKRLERIIGYVSPYTRFSKVLRQYIYGLDHLTQKEIFSKLEANYLNIRAMTLSDLFVKNLCEIEINDDQFSSIFIEPLLKYHKSLFECVGISKIMLEHSKDTMHDKFLELSNIIYRYVSNNFNLPLLELRDLRGLDKRTSKAIQSEKLKIQIELELQYQKRYLEAARLEYKKALKGYSSGIKYHHKKKIIEKYDKDVSRSLKRKYFISDYEFINFLESEDASYLDLFELDKEITRSLSAVSTNDMSDTSQFMKYIDIKTLLDGIFATQPRVIVTQQFAREFDYNYYDKLATHYGVHIYPSSITIWKDDGKMKFRNTKLMSFLFGLNLLFNKYVR